MLFTSCYFLVDFVGPKSKLDLEEGKTNEEFDLTSWDDSNDWACIEYVKRVGVAGEVPCISKPSDSSPRTENFFSVLLRTRDCPRRRQWMVPVHPIVVSLPAAYLQGSMTIRLLTALLRMAEMSI